MTAHWAQKGPYWILLDLMGPYGLHAIGLMDLWALWAQVEVAQAHVVLVSMDLLATAYNVLTSGCPDHIAVCFLKPQICLVLPFLDVGSSRLQHLQKSSIVYKSCWELRHWQEMPRRHPAQDANLEYGSCLYILVPKVSSVFPQLASITGCRRKQSVIGTGVV